MRQTISRVLPASWRPTAKRSYSWLRSLGNYCYDARRFMTASSAGRSLADRQRMAAQLTMDYHRIEKGLALSEPRPGFGQDVIARLTANLSAYRRRFGEDDLVRTVLAVLLAYRDGGHARPDLERMLGAEATGTPDVEAGTVAVDHARLFPFDTQAVEPFLLSRHSVRQFTGAQVPAETIERIVRLAQRAPSVCNRQGGRVFASNEPQRMTRMLKFQNGNRGFGHTLGAVFIVAVDMRVFTSLGERNQAFVDGGIFAMALLQAMHSQKLGACMLNWSVEAKTDRALRRAFDIAGHYAVITMIGCGAAVEQPLVAASRRIDTAEVLQWL